MRWEDLLIDDLPREQVEACLGPWQTLIGGRIAPLVMSRFGFWFFMRPTGKVEALDVFSGYVSAIADDREEFMALVNSPDWQECYLFPSLVAELHSHNIIPGSAQCFALGAHPAQGGPNPANGELVDPKTVMVMDATVWQSICAQLNGVGA